MIIQTAGYVAEISGRLHLFYQNKISFWIFHLDESNNFFLYVFSSLLEGVGKVYNFYHFNLMFVNN